VREAVDEVAEPGEAIEPPAQLPLPQPEQLPQTGSPRAILNATQQAGFDRFWTDWPRKRKKGDALKAWKALAPDEALTERILAAVARARASPDWRREGGRFIPYPATWLRALGWEDELEVTVEPLREVASSGPETRFHHTVSNLKAIFGDDDGQDGIPTGPGLLVGGLRR
jgi:hypothetical protein